MCWRAARYYFMAVHPCMAPTAVIGLEQSFVLAVYEGVRLFWR